jgi:hypothetical protein
MADEVSRPDPDETTRTVGIKVDRIPGQRDMSSFEHVLAGPPADGPRLQWLIAWPDGRVTAVDDEDDALAAVRAVHGCRLLRRYVTACVPRSWHAEVRGQGDVRT